MIHGIINVYKEKGFTSHDVVAKLRKIAGQKKIGHTGTLDPEAEGVLPVCFGKATKLCGLLTEEDKTYETVLLLGRTTDTQDAAGRVLSQKSADFLTEEEVTHAVLSFAGEYWQIPPMYSALKVNGKRLYELARKGQEVERKARRVSLYDVRVLHMSLPRVRMSVTCSRGTYIRTLCHDVGESLGCGGCMEELVRTRAGRFSIESAHRLEEIERFFAEEKAEELVMPVDALFCEAPKVRVKEEWEMQARNGNALPENAVDVPKSFPDDARVRLYDGAERFIALYRWREGAQEYSLEKMFFPEV